MREELSGPIRVLVVDDSAVVRRLMLELLSLEAGFYTATAADGIIAQRKVESHDPHVVLLDLEMPRMDGLTFLRTLMAEDPRPVVICSGYAARGTQNAVEALSEGAVDIVSKPALRVGEFLQESRDLLVEVVTAAARARIGPPRARPEPRPRARTTSLATAAREHEGRVLALGASTGGPQAIDLILREMPEHAPPILVAQHMPEPFVGAFAFRLNGCCAVEVRRAEEGDEVRPGLALIAPGDRHMELKRHSHRRLEVRLSSEPPVSGHRPSVDVLFRSVAQAADPGSVGVLLTGMGTDGASGLLAMKHAGMVTLAQDRATSVVHGMPREAVLRHAHTHVVPLGSVARQALELLE